MGILKNFFAREFFRSNINLWLLILSLSANAANWTALFIFIRPVDSSIILHYNVYFGVDDVGKWNHVYILPAIGLLLLTLNAWLAYFFYAKKERIAGYALLLTGLILQVSLIIASVSVIIINY